MGSKFRYSAPVHYFGSVIKKNTGPIETGTFYHVYNRGINGQNLFFHPRNYEFFLRKYAEYITPAADTYAYCLLPNHFHLLIKTKSAPEIISNLPLLEQHAAPEIVSLRFSHFFNAYAQAINKQQNPTGGLFETPFRRTPVSNAGYLCNLVHYIHSNAQKHRLVADFKEYPYSSFQSFRSPKESRLKRSEVYDWFESAAAFMKIHQSEYQHGRDVFFRDVIIEFD